MEKIIGQVLELRIGESELTFGTESPVDRDKRGLARAAPNVDEQGANAESRQTWLKQPWGAVDSPISTGWLHECGISGNRSCVHGAGNLDW